MILIYVKIICFISSISNIYSVVDIKKINENSQLKFSLNNNLYLSSSIFINDKEYEVPIDISSDRTWINIVDNKYNHNKELSIRECPIYDLIFNPKKNVPISFFDKNLILEDISYDELSNNLNDMECDTKKGVIGLSQKSEKKATNLLEQLNKSFLLKKCFSLYKNELIIGNFEEEIKQKRHITAKVSDYSENKWNINIQGIFYGEIDNSYINNQKEFKINIMNSNYKKLNFNVEFNSLQKMIIVEFYFLDSLNEKIFKNKCNIKENEKEKFSGIYCKTNTFDNIQYISFMINNQLLAVPLEKFFIKDKNNPDEYLFLIGFSDIIWEKGPCIVGNYFLNELEIKTIFDADNGNVYLFSDYIVENVKIINDYSVDDKQIILNNNSFSVYDFALCFILISNFFGILILLASLYKEKFFGKMSNKIKRIKRMNKQ